MRTYLALCLFLSAVPIGAAMAEETPPSISPDEPAVPAEVPRDAQIDALFATLHDAKDKAAAKVAEGKITSLWLESGSATADLLMRWTLAAMEKNDYPRALDFLDRIVIMQPDYVEGWNKRATVYFLMEDYGKSIADIGKVLEIEPRHFGALSGLGMILRAIGDDKRAIEAYRQALALDPFLDNVKDALDELEKAAAGREI